MRKILVIFATLLLMQNLSAVDWKAKWIGAPWEGEEYCRDSIAPAPEFRKAVIFDKRVKKATAFVTGLGFFEFYVNGKKMGNDVLSPNETSYGHRSYLPYLLLPVDDSNWRDFRVMYLTFDITSCLHKGENDFIAILGNGFYATGTRLWAYPYGTPRFICQIEIEYVDGTSELVTSDESWKVRFSPIIYNDIFLGEDYDARMENHPDWHDAVLREAPGGRLVEQDGPADRVVDVLKPVSIVRLDDGRWEVDFGDYISGWIKLRNFKAPEGTSISLEFPVEEKNYNGRYTYICDGSRVRSYSPRFCWWTFRKVIVSGWPGKLRPCNIRAEVVNSDVKEYASFDCSNHLLVRIHEIWKRTILDNMHLGVATDCPHREKGPYTGDGEASCVAVMHNFDTRTFYKKWLHDMSDCQDTVTGYVPNGAPWHPGCGGGVPWGSAMCIIPWEYYIHYGDISVLEEHFEAMKGYVGYLKGWCMEDGTVLQQLPSPENPLFYMNLGEWCPPYNLPSENFVHTWFLWRCATFTAKAATALGRADDASAMFKIADETATAFHSKFYNNERGSYEAGRGVEEKNNYGTGDGNGVGDGSNIFALEMGVPQDRIERVLETVKEEIRLNNGHFNTGIFGSSLFFEVLCRFGLSDEAYTAMTKKDFPSFGYWIEQGAQTTWEQWNGKQSHNHPMFGGSLVWMYRYLCGVQTDEAEPGYKHIILKPTPAGDLCWASYKTETSYGKLSVRWDLNDNGTFVLKTRIPKGTHATLYMPDGNTVYELKPGRHRKSCIIN